MQAIFSSKATTFLRCDVPFEDVHTDVEDGCSKIISNSKFKEGNKRPLFRKQRSKFRDDNDIDM